MNKKWVLVLLFSFSNNIMHAEAELNENISLVQNESVEKIIKLALEESDKKIEEKSLSRWQRLKRTVKSDLCIGDDIESHDSLGSQLKASLRLIGYSMLTRIPILYVQGGIIPDLSVQRNALAECTKMQRAVFLGGRSLL